MKKGRAFTLVEVLVAVTIMLLMIGAAASIEVTYLNSDNLNKHTIQANSLAQEGFSLVDLLRDQNLISSSDSFANFPTNSEEIIEIDGIKFKRTIRVSN
jgi:prepilin-type N-terminal cleavage/methylation domain-containing protein